MIRQYLVPFWQHKKTETRSDILVNPAVQSMMRDVNGKRLLDLGCGDGNLMEEFANRGANVIGIDIETDRFPKHPRSQTTYVQADITDLPLTNKYFDAAYSSMAFLHLDQINLELALQEAWRVLKPGGNLVVADVHPTALIQSKKPTLVEHHSRGANYFSHQQVSASIYDTKGNRTQIEYFHRSLEEYLNAFLRNGFMLSQVHEPRPSEKLRSAYKGLLEVEEEQPSYILFKLKRGEHSD